MKALAMATLALLLWSCGDSSSGPSARTVRQACDEFCAWPEACFAELGLLLEVDDCVPQCEASIDSVGVDCLFAVADMLECLGTCEIDTLSDRELASCQSVAMAASSACGD